MYNGPQEGCCADDDDDVAKLNEVYKSYKYRFLMSLIARRTVLMQFVFRTRRHGISRLTFSVSLSNFTCPEYSVCATQKDSN